MRQCRSRGMKRLFWRVYSHGLLLLLLAFVASAGVWAIFGHADHWRRNLSTVASLVGARCGQGTTTDDGRSSIAAVSERIGLSIGCFDPRGRETERGGSPLPAPTVEQRDRLARDSEEVAAPQTSAAGRSGRPPSRIGVRLCGGRRSSPPTAHRARLVVARRSARGARLGIGPVGAGHRGAGGGHDRDRPGGGRRRFERADRGVTP